MRVLSILLALSLALIGAAMAAQAQKKISLEIRNVSRNDAQAKKGLDGKSRLVPVNFQWRRVSTVAAKLVELEAVLETVNTDGKRSRVSKSITDGTSNTFLQERFDLLLPEGVSARDFKLTLRGKWRAGNAAELIEVSEVKTGNFP